jgi:hypothetical protein
LHFANENNLTALNRVKKSAFPPAQRLRKPGRERLAELGTSAPNLHRLRRRSNSIETVSDVEINAIQVMKGQKP